MSWQEPNMIGELSCWVGPSTIRIWTLVQWHSRNYWTNHLPHSSSSSAATNLHSLLNFNVDNIRTKTLSFGYSYTALSFSLSLFSATKRWILVLFFIFLKENEFWIFWTNLDQFCFVLFCLVAHIIFCSSQSGFSISSWKIIYSRENSYFHIIYY